MELALWNFVQAMGSALIDWRKTLIEALDIKGVYDGVWHTCILAQLGDLHVHPGLLG